MPELPDVEGFRRVLASGGAGRRVRRVEVADAGVLRGVTQGGFRRQLTGRRLGEPERHGKWLIAPTDGPTLLLHFGMTGRLLRPGPDEPRHPHDRVVLALDDGGELRYRDQRKLRGLWLAATGDDAARIMGEQGPDALAVDRAGLERLLAGRRQAVKAALTDQAVLAGLGNLLGDEILWRAGIHPRRRADRLTPDERRRLGTEMRRVLRESVRAGHVPARPTWLTGHRDEPGGHCPRCRGPLHHDRMAGRTTTWCPHCQPPAT
ncbi:formamidopyrimidine-DNA glycosylase [Streptomyces capparidis]